MPEPDPLRSEHPKGTLVLMGLYGVLFAVGWFVVYLVYLYRGGVTP